MAVLAVGLLLFFGIHSVSIGMPSLRTRAVEHFGLAAWRGIYSGASLAGLLLIIWGYGLARQHPMLVYSPPLSLRSLALLLMLPVFPLLAAAYLPGHIQRRVKHPMLLAIKIWGTAHLLANGTLADVALFGAFVLWAGLERMSLKTRASSLSVTGPVKPWNDALAVSLGLAIYAAFVLGGHQFLIGVPVSPRL